MIKTRDPAINKWTSSTNTAPVTSVEDEHGEITVNAYKIIKNSQQAWRKLYSIHVGDTNIPPDIHRAPKKLSSPMTLPKLNETMFMNKIKKTR